MLTPRSQLLGVLMRRTMLAAMSSPRTAALPLSMSLFLALPLRGQFLSQEPAAQRADAPHYAFSHVLSTDRSPSSLCASLSDSTMFTPVNKLTIRPAVMQHIPLRNRSQSRPQAPAQLYSHPQVPSVPIWASLQSRPQAPAQLYSHPQVLPYLSRLACRVDPRLPPSYTLTLRSFRTYLG
jgi:hypothetical protein